MSVSGGTMSGRRVAQDPISATLALLQDTDKFKARLKQLTDAEASLRATTSQYENIANINQNKAAAKAARTRAETVLAEAETKAKAIVQEAMESASQTRQLAQSEKAQAEKAAKLKAKELEERETGLAHDEADYLKRSTVLARTETTTHNRAVKNLALKKDLERKANVLKAACNEVLG